MSRLMRALAVSASAAWTGACGSATTQGLTSPSTDVKCAVTAVATPSSFAAAGGSGTLTVSANRECPWSAAATSGWIQLGGSASGQGDASIAFTVAANADPAARTATISVSDQQIGI